MNFEITTTQTIVLGVLAVWDLYWRGRALWHSAQAKNRNWFIALLLINSIGILPIIYLYNTRQK